MLKHLSSYQLQSWWLWVACVEDLQTRLASTDLHKICKREAEKLGTVRPHRDGQHHMVVTVLAETFQSHPPQNSWMNCARWQTQRRSVTPAESSAEPLASHICARAPVCFPTAPSLIQMFSGMHPEPGAICYWNKSNKKMKIMKIRERTWLCCCT